MNTNFPVLSHGELDELLYIGTHRWIINKSTSRYDRYAERRLVRYINWGKHSTRRQVELTQVGRFVIGAYEAGKVREGEAALARVRQMRYRENLQRIRREQAVKAQKLQKASRAK